MKTIEEKAKDYAIACYPSMSDVRLQCEMHFEAGAEWMRKELTRWRDPKEVLPEIGKCVLIKVVDQLENEAIYLGSREGDEYMLDGMGDFAVGAYFDDESMPDMNIKVIGWREIL